jgi:hypothetical protein
MICRLECGRFFVLFQNDRLASVLIELSKTTAIVLKQQNRLNSMNSKHPAVILLITFLFAFLNTDAVHCSDTPPKFSFFEIGSDDTIGSALNKITQHGFRCLKGKATSLKLDFILKNLEQKKNATILNRLASQDTMLENFGQNLTYEQMPIELLSCTPLQENPFAFVSIYFSTFDASVIGLQVENKQVDAAKQKLHIKFGACIFDGYCENEQNLIIFLEKPGWNMNVIFPGNFEQMFTEAKAFKKRHDQQVENQIDSAF